MIPTTIEILTLMTNASPRPVKNSGSSVGMASASTLMIASDAQEADDREDGDRQDRPEQPGAQLPEVVDERHHRLVAGRGGRRWERLRVGRHGTSADTRLAQGVSVGHGRVEGARLAGGDRRIGGVRRAGGGGLGRIRRVGRGRVGRQRAGAWATGAGAAAGAAGAGGVAGIGDVSTSTLTASWTSDDALRNSLMLLPSEAPTSGSSAGAEDEERDHQDDDQLEGSGSRHDRGCSCGQGSDRCARSGPGGMRGLG